MAQHKVMLAPVSQAIGRGGNSDYQLVIFDPQPTISETGSVGYSTSNTRLNSDIVVYSGTQSRTYSINADFVSRNAEEADSNFKKLQILRSWRWREGTVAELVPPTVLRLRGYNKIFNSIPVVVTSVTTEFSNDVDYIVGSSADMPIVLSVSVSLLEAQHYDINGAGNAVFKQMDLAQYRNGGILGW